MTRAPPRDLTPLGFQILLALAGGPQHGYAIGKQVEARSEGRLSPSTGSLYQALRRLHEDGLIAETRVDDGSRDARRQYFRITSSGRAAAGREASRLAELVSLARQRALLPSGRS